MERQMEQQDRTAELPRTGYARAKQVLRVIPFAPSTLWSKVKEGEFPKPVKLSANVTAWKCADVWQWLEAREKQAA